MGRIIDIELNNKKYTLEYDRLSVLRFMEAQKSIKEDDGLTSVINLVRCGLLKHHKESMPSDDDVLELLLSLGDQLGAFTSELSNCINEVITSLKATQSGNLKWGVRK